MINGTVAIVGQEGPITLWEPRVEIAVAGVGLRFETVEVVVDTGFTGALALPSRIVQGLGLTREGERQIHLAHGQGSLPVYGAAVSWLGQLRATFVYEIDGTALLGAALLTNCRLAIDFQEGGDVAIQPLWEPQPE